MLLITCSDFDSEGAVLDVSILDGDAEQMISFNVGPPDHLVEPVLAVRDRVSNLSRFRVENRDFDRVTTCRALLLQLIPNTNNEPLSDKCDKELASRQLQKIST